MANAKTPRTGATVRTEAEHGAPLLVEPTPDGRVTAGELRAKGYTVPDRFADHEVPTEYASATARTEAEHGAPHLVQQPSTEHIDDLTARERAALQPVNPDAADPDLAPPRADNLSASERARIDGDVVPVSSVSEPAVPDDLTPAERAAQSGDGSQ